MILNIVLIVLLFALLMFTIITNRAWYNRLIAQNRVWSDINKKNQKEWVQMIKGVIDRFSETEMSFEHRLTELEHKLSGDENDSSLQDDELPYE